MQDGIGRGGYRILAFVFLSLGALGLAAAALALDPAGFFEWLGFGLAGLALLALTILALASLSGTPRRAAMAPAPQPEPIDLEAMEELPEGDPTADLGIEYDAPEQDPTPGPPRVQPPPVPVVQPRRVPKDTKGWPAPPAPSGRTRREVTEGGLPRDPGPDIDIEGPAAPRRDPPVLMARTVASAEATGIPDGTGVGKCGNCGVLLLAPKKRPLRLQCPRCERIHTLA